MPEPSGDVPPGSRHLDALPTGYLLHWYRIERVLGQGGFGITYLAQDTNLDHAVAIKEYLPVEFTTRAPDLSVWPRFEDLREKYQWGLDRFISEARTLAKFDHPSIVRVYSVFEANSTAYMVMRYERGENLDAMLERPDTLPERELMGILLPVLDGLAQVHAAGFIHRDIKPDNLYVRADGSPVLIDFGSARDTVGTSNTMTILVAPGYAPLEQYYGTPGLQGPWTDIYSLGATMYRVVTGATPMDAIARSRGILGSTQDILKPASEIARTRYSERFLLAIDHALRFDEKERPQTIDEWRRELCGVEPPAPPPAAVIPADAAGGDVPGAPAPAPHAAVPADRGWRALSIVFGLLAFVLALVLGRDFVRDGSVDAAATMTRELRDRIDRLGAQNERTMALVEEARRARDEAAKHQAGVQRERDASQRRAAELEASVAQLREALARAGEQQTRDDETTARLGELSAQFERASVEITRLRAERDALSAKVEQSSAEITRLRGERDELAATARSASAGRAAITAPPAVAPQSVPRSAPPPAAAAPAVDHLALGLQAYRCRRFEQAREHLEALGEPGDAQAAAALGTMLLDGQGGSADPARARMLLKAAAGNGIAQAQHRLGVMYATGRGGARDESEAVRWYRKAADAGFSDAQVSLATMYMTGRGVARDPGEALRWYTTAARAGNPTAQAALGQFYLAGNGVPQNELQAYAWLYAAGRNGDDSHRQELDRMEKRMIPQVLGQARKLGEQYAHRYPVPADAAPRCDA